MTDDRLRRYGPPVTVFVVTFLAFLPALSAEFVNFDDGRFIDRNPRLESFSLANLKWMFTDMSGVYIPLTWVSLALDHAVWGWEAGGFHMTNVLLHALNAVILYFLIMAVLARLGDVSRWIAVAGALIFAVHPLRAESVAWVTERRDLLSGTFLLLTMLAYLRMAKEPDASSGRRWYVASIALFALSLLSKASAMALPVALLAIDVYPLRRFVPGRRARILAEKLPFLILSITIAVVAFFAQRGGGAAVGLDRHGISERIIQAAYGLCFYVWKTVVPLGLSPLYPLEKVTLSKPYFLAGLIGAALITAVLIALRRRRPELLVAWIIYAALVSPVLGMVQSGPHLVADRFSYHSCMPWAIIAAAGIWWLYEKRAGWLAPAAAGAILVCLAGLTFRQSGFWSDSITLWSRVLDVGERNAVAHYHRGDARMRTGDFAGAIADFDRTIAIDPQYFRAAVLYYRGVARSNLGDMSAAWSDFKLSLESAPGDWPYRAMVEDALRGISQPRH